MPKITEMLTNNIVLIAAGIAGYLWFSRKNSAQTITATSPYGTAEFVGIR